MLYRIMTLEKWSSAKRDKSSPEID